MQCGGSSSDGPADLVRRGAFVSLINNIVMMMMMMLGVMLLTMTMTKMMINPMIIMLNDCRLILPNLPFSWGHLGDK